MLILKPVEEEARDCRARCAGMKVGDLILHCHHEVLCEILTKPVEDRISFIISSKSDNVPLRLRLMGPPIIDDQVKDDPRWYKANVELEKAYAEWRKANTELDKAYAEWRKANTEWRKANTEYNKAYAEQHKANAELDKAYAEWRKANTEWRKTYEPHYHRLYPDSPWNGETIFAGEFKRL